MLNWNSMLGFLLEAFAQQETKPEKSDGFRRLLLTQERHQSGESLWRHLPFPVFELSNDDDGDNGDDGMVDPFRRLLRQLLLLVSGKTDIKGQSSCVSSRMASRSLLISSQNSA
jgi:hypothetical protein